MGVNVAVVGAVLDPTAAPRAPFITAFASGPSPAGEPIGTPFGAIRLHPDP